jgi:hypothetical protein
MRGSQNPVTPSNTPVIAGVFAKQPMKPAANGSTPSNSAQSSAAEDEVAEKMKKLGQ